MKPIPTFAKVQKNYYHLWKNCKTNPHFYKRSRKNIIILERSVRVQLLSSCILEELWEQSTTKSSPPTYCAQEQKTNEPPNWGLAWNRKMSTFPELTENSKVWAPFVSVSLNQTLHCWKHVLFLPNMWCFYKTGGKLQKDSGETFLLRGSELIIKTWSWLTKLRADYQSLELIIKTWSWLTKLGADYQNLELINKTSLISRSL